MQSTDERYERLKGEVRRPLIAPPGSKTGTPPQPGAGEKSGKQPSPGAGKQKGKQQAPGGGLQTLDDHSVWEEARQDPDRSKEAIDQVVREAVQEVGDENVPDYLAEAAGVHQKGDTPGGDEIKLGGRRPGQLDWRTLLRRYVGQLLQLRPIFNRPKLTSAP